MICLECAKEFPVRPSAQKRGQVKYCSWSCRDKNGHISGTRNPNAKMNWNTVLAMRERYVPYQVSIRDLAREYGLSKTQTFEILKFRAWV